MPEEQDVHSYVSYSPLRSMARVCLLGTLLAAGVYLIRLILALAFSLGDWRWPLFVCLVLAAPCTALTLLERGTRWPRRVGLLLLIPISVLSADGLLWLSIRLAPDLRQTLRMAILYWNVTVLIALAALVALMLCRWPRVAVSLALSLLGLVGLTLEYLALKQLNHARSVERLWKDRGWPTSRGELVFAPGISFSCEQWLDELRSLDHWDYEETWARLKKTVETADDIRVIRSTFERSHWREQIGRSVKLLTLAGRCRTPFELDTDRDARIAEYHLQAWTSLIGTDALARAGSGQPRQGLRQCLMIEAALHPLRLTPAVRGYSTASDTARCLAAVLALTGCPDDVLQVELRPEVAKFDWLRPKLDADGVSSLVLCLRPSAVAAAAFPASSFLGELTPNRVGAVMRVNFHDTCAEGLSSLSRQRLWLEAHPEAIHPPYLWFEVKSLEPTHYYILQYLYRQAMKEVAILRVVQAANLVLAVRGEDGEFPLTLLDTPEDWPLDPFDGRPMRYRSLDAYSFRVYSVGPDVVDDGGTFAGPRDPDIGLALRVDPSASCGSQ
jgi:hypothetical protein